MEEQQEKPKRKQKQLYFGNRDNQLWEWVQSLPKQEGNAEICAILNYYLFGGVKPKTPSYWDMIEKSGINPDQSQNNSTERIEKKVQNDDLEDELLR